MARGFDSVAGQYERARPSYPPEAIEALRRRLDIGPGSRVCDLAAGTGKLTRLLVGTGADVVAIEPVPGMRAKLADVLPDVEIVDGVAETIPLPDASVDVVTVAQAFHWFRFDEALAEINRVLRPSGGLAILFNERDEREPWVKTWNDVIEWHGRRISFYQRTDWVAVMEQAGFVDVGHISIEWRQSMTRVLLEDRVRSVSYIAAEPETVQREYVDRVLALVADRSEPFDLPYVTTVWWSHKRS